MNNKLFLCASIVSLVSFSVSAQAQAQSSEAVAPEAGATIQDSAAPAESGEIVVTAQRRNERLRDVPIAIVSVSGERLESAGISDLSDIKLAAPGATVRYSTGYALAYIRGVGSSARTAIAEAPVATYVDEVYIASQNNLTAFSNVESVEVLKGPQGTLFGRNSSGGLFNIKTIDPSFEPTGKFHVGYGNYDTVNGDGYIATGLSDKIAADISFYASHQGDGYGRNVNFPGDSYKTYYALGVRSKWLITPDDDTRIVAIFDHSRMKSSAGVSGQYVKGSNLTPTLRAPQYNNDYDNVTNFQPMARSQTSGASINVSHEFDQGFQLKSITAYRSDSLDLDLDADGSSIDALNVYQDLKTKTFTQELQAQSTGAGPFSWTAGLFYFNGHAKFDPPQRVTLPVVVPGLTQLADYDFSAESIAVYGQGTYALGPNTKLTLGARYTHEKRTISGTLFNQFPGMTLVAFGPTRQTKNDNDVSFRASLDHKITPDVLIYASFNSGFKSGGFTNVNLPPYEPEKIYAYEAGLKARLFGGLANLNIAGFYYDYKDVQVQVVTGTSLGTIVRNGAAAEIYGFDIDGNVNLGAGFSLNGSFEYLNAKYKSYRNASIASLPNGGGNLIAGDVTGNRLPYAPEYSANVGLVHSLPLGSGKLNSSVLAYFSGKYYAQVDNYVSQDAYTSINASIEYESDAGFSIKGWVRNLTDERVLQNATNSGAFFVTYDPPRTYGVTLGYHF